MRLVNYGERGAEQPGLLVDDHIVPLAQSIAALGIETLRPNGMVQLIPVIEELLHREVLPWTEAIEARSIRMGAPVTHPSKIVEVAWNTSSMLDVSGDPPWSAPAIYSKSPNSVTGPRDVVVRPRQTRKLDYEVELAVVIGKRCSAVTATEAVDYIAGYTVANDITARDVQFGDFEGGRYYRQNFLSKGFDTFCPLGPSLVTKDEVDDLASLRVRSFVNGELRQDGTLGELIWDVSRLCEYVSGCMTLEAGDVILVGAPAGVGHYLKEPTYLNPGDVVQGEISGLGMVVNKVVEP